MQQRKNHIFYLAMVTLAGWLIPGGGFFLIKETRRAIIIFVTIAVIFIIGLYVGSTGVIDPVNAKLWFAIQTLTTPLVLYIGFISSNYHEVYARPQEIGQIYTSIAGMLNLLCIINAIHKAYDKATADKVK